MEIVDCVVECFDCVVNVVCQFVIDVDVEQDFVCIVYQFVCLVGDYQCVDDVCEWVYLDLFECVCEQQVDDCQY